MDISESLVKSFTKHFYQLSSFVLGFLGPLLLSFSSPYPHHPFYFLSGYYSTVNQGAIFILTLKRSYQFPVMPRAISVILLLYFSEDVDVSDLVFIRSLSLLLDSWFGDFFWLLHKYVKGLDRQFILSQSFLRPSAPQPLSLSNLLIFHIISYFISPPLSLSLKKHRIQDRSEWH